MQNAQISKQETDVSIRRDTEGSRSFNSFDVRAPFAEWVLMDYLTVNEAVALSMSRDPAKVTWKTLKDYVNISRVAKEYMRRRELLQRAIRFGKLSSRFSVTDFVIWAIKKQLSLPVELLAVVNKTRDEIIRTEIVKIDIAVKTIFGCDDLVLVESSSDDPDEIGLKIESPLLPYHRKKPIEDFLAMASINGVLETDMSAWQEFATWGCFKLQNSTISCDWINSARAFAEKRLNDARNAEKPIQPNQNDIAKEIAANFAGRIMTSKGKPIYASYVIRMALSGWWTRELEKLNFPKRTFRKNFSGS
jgi:hypothetical protein